MNSNILKLMVCATIPVALLSCKKDEEPVKTDYIISQYENNELPERFHSTEGHSKSMSKSIPSRNPTSKYSSRGNTASSSAERRRRQ